MGLDAHASAGLLGTRVVSVTPKASKSATDLVREAERAKALAKDWKVVSAFLREHPQMIRDDDGLLEDLGLWIKAANVVEFGPAALARLSAAKTREKAVRRELEATARANFAAQAQTHAAVVDLLEARNHADLARRVDDIARLRFGLTTAGVVALEMPGAVPAGWRSLGEDGVTALLGPGGLARMGAPEASRALFGGWAVRWAASPWPGWRSGSRRVKRCLRLARLIRRPSPATWAPSWSPSSLESPNARPNDGRCFRGHL